MSHKPYAVSHRQLEQAERLASLGISQRAAARDLNVPASTFSGYIRTGRLTANLDDLPERVERYIKIKNSVAKAARVTSAPLHGRWVQLGVSLYDLSEALGIARDVLKRGIYQGLWPDEFTKNAVEQWMQQTINSQEGKKMITKISLAEDHLRHWSLKRDPFTNEMETEEDVADLKPLRDAEKKILNAISKNGWVAITGDVGSGKSTLLKKVEARLSKQKEVAIVKSKMIEKQYLGAGHVCDSILTDLGCVTSLAHRTLESKARLVGQTLEEAYRDGRKVVILIDEAHLLRPEALLALKRIYEFEIGFRKLLSIVLVGQVGLARQLKGNFALKEVSQRVDLFELGGLNGQIGNYLSHKLERAGLNGASGDVFDKSALKAFAERNADTPLSVNNLAAASLIAAWDLGEKTVTGEIVRSIPGSF